MFKRVLAAALLGAPLAGLPLPAAAQSSSKQQINMFAFEDSSCKKWTESRNDAYKRAFYEVWLRGFMSGHNYANPRQQVPTGGMPRDEGLHRFLDDYCKLNPGDSVFDAAIWLANDLRPSGGLSTPRKDAPAKK
ncbi:MAG: hypothetical protein ACREUW_16035 [Burkholderiales bacterium]